MKVILENNEGSTSSNTSTTSDVHSTCLTFTKEQNDSTINAKEISSCLSDVELIASSTASTTLSSSTYYQMPATVAATSSAYQVATNPSSSSSSVSQTYPSNSTARPYHHIAASEETNGHADAQQLQQVQYLAQFQMPTTTTTTTAAAAAAYSHQLQPNGQAYGTGMDQAMQFMQAMHQSVNQVANAPHFGFEWVKPDYQFDPMTEFTDSDVVLTTTIDDADQSSAHFKSVIAQTPSSNRSESLPLTDRETDEIYDVLQEFDSNTKILVGERLITTSQLYQQ